MANSTLTINFVATGAGADTVKIELDEEKNDEKTSFLYGTAAWFIVFLDTTQYDYDLIITDGTKTNNGDRTVYKEIDFQFVEDEAVDTGYPIDSVDSYTYYGTSLGAVSKYSLFEITTAIKPDISLSRIAIGKAGIFTTGKSHSITVGQKDVDEYPVLVVVNTKPKTT